MPSSASRAWEADEKKPEYGTVEPEKTGSSHNVQFDNVSKVPDERWMSQISSDVLLSSLTLPGTHDSAARTYGLPFIDTQSLTILQQLNAGVRYLDLRCGIRNNIIEMVHGPTILGQRLDELLNVLYTWLESHPTEALVVQIKEDREPEKSSIHFPQAIYKHISAKTDMWRTANTTPVLGELRGKIQLFRRFRGPRWLAYGIDVTEWQDNPSTPFTIRSGHEVQLTIQDHYNFSDPTPLPELIAIKGGDVSGLLHRASDDLESGHWYLNFTSASEFNLSHQLPPREIAVGGYSFFKWIDGLNPRLATFVKIREGKQRYGIIAMDFPEQGTSDLIHVLIMSNFKHKAAIRLRQRIVLCAVVVFTLLISLVVGSGLVLVQKPVDRDLRAEGADYRRLLTAGNLDA